MKWQTIDEFVTFCRENQDKRFIDMDEENWTLAMLWRDALSLNTEQGLITSTTSRFIKLYDAGVKLFGADNFNQSLQQFFDDNKDTL